MQICLRRWAMDRGQPTTALEALNSLVALQCQQGTAVVLAESEESTQQPSKHRRCRLHGSVGSSVLLLALLLSLAMLLWSGALLKRPWPRLRTPSTVDSILAQEVYRRPGVGANTSLSTSVPREERTRQGHHRGVPGAEGVEWMEPQEPEPNVKEFIEPVVGREAEGDFEWEVVFDDGPVNVRSKKDLHSSVLSIKRKGDIIIGREAGSWVELIHEHGFVKRLLLEPHTVLLKHKRVSYAQLSSGSCRDVGRFPILDASACYGAGLTLGYEDSGLEVYRGSELVRPEGCYVLDGQLWLATNPSNRGNGASRVRKPICSSIASYAGGAG